MIFYIIGFLVIAGFGLVILKIRNRILLNIEQAEKSEEIQKNVRERPWTFKNFANGLLR